VYLSPNPQLEPALSLRDGIPPLERPLPDLRPEAVNETNADSSTGSYRAVYPSASLSIEREIRFQHADPGSIHRQRTDTYVGNSAANFNAIPLSALSFRDQLNDEAFNRSLRPYPQYKSLNVAACIPGRYAGGAYLSVENEPAPG